MNFKDYQSQIKVLIPLRNQSDFSLMIDKIFFGESSSDKFLIKMEISRLSQTCKRIIDLRDKVTDKTTQYEHANLIHYLTAGADKQLVAGINLYGGYTIGVYEHVLDYAQKVKQEQTQAAKLAASTDTNEYITENISINRHLRLPAPLMYYVSPISLQFSDGSEYEASTSNISISGLKVKLSNDNKVFEEQLIQVTFTGLTKEYKNKATTDQKISYRLVRQQKEKTGYYLYLKYEDKKPNFIHFIKLFIRANQHKYKLDVAHFFNVAREKLLKNAVLGAMDALPIYLDANSSTPILFMLRNNINKKILSDWYCNSQNQLGLLFNEDRLATLLTFTQPTLSTTVYTFTYINDGEEFLLSATEEELNRYGLKHLFFEYGRNKPSWHCYHLTLENYEYKEFKHYKFTETRPESFSDITHVATLTEINTKEIIEVDTRTQKGNPDLLNKLVHREKLAGFIPVYDLFPDEMRKEERYAYNSAIQIKTNGANEESLAASVIDFSVSGLKIKLSSTKLLVRRSLVKIDFIELQKISSKFNLMGIQYTVISSSTKNVYHLEIASSEDYLVFSQFLSLLVSKNPSFFKVIPLKSYKQPVSSRLQDVAQASLQNAFFYVSTQDSRPKITFSTIFEKSTLLKQLFNFNCKNNEVNNHIALANNKLLDRILCSPLRSVTSTDKAIDFERTIYVQKVKNEDNKWIIKSFLDEDFENQAIKRAFIVDNKKLNQLQILHYRLNFIKPINLEDIKLELDIIHRHAMHLSQRIEDEMLNINAFIQVIDRTEQILAPHSL